MVSLAFSNPVRLLSIFLIFAFSCCEDSGISESPTPCTSKEDIRHASINAFDRNPISGYYGKVVAVFSLEQSSTVYSGLSCGKLMDCANKLSVKNVTNRTISFDFDIRYSLNLASWNYQNFVSIPPNSTYDFGTINTNCASLSLGNIQLSGSSIDYK